MGMGTQLLVTNKRLVSMPF
ncbi:hypothetical protein Gotur_001120 [Gossypium turneri]